MPLHTRLACFTKLGKKLAACTLEEQEDLARAAKAQNPWFTSDSTRFALQGLVQLLDEDKLVDFILNYPTLNDTRPTYTIGVVMAGNIPAVGFHDALCVLLSGHRLLAKLSKDDQILMRYLLEQIILLEPAMAPFIEITERLSGMDAVICTGSDNSARYFEHYFGKYPHIIRKNRTSIAILDGKESKQELDGLVRDVLTYYGLGCRNVSKLYIPSSQPIEKIIDAFEEYAHVIDNHKYANNYTYNRAVLLLNQEAFLDNGFVLFKESDSLHSPLSVLFYEKYDSEAELEAKLKALEGQLQCVVGHSMVAHRIPFGQAQQPSVFDFADSVDTMSFLLALS